MVHSESGTNDIEQSGAWNGKTNNDVPQRLSDAKQNQASFPWLLTVIHTFATSIGCVATMGFGSVKFTRASLKENLIIVTFSVLFTLNIAVSNASLAMVSIPLHQILRSTCPLVTMLIYRIVFGRAYSATLYVSMIPLILGVGLATAGDYYCTLAGFLCTMVGVILAVVKTIASNRLMTGTLALSPMELLLRMSPLAAIQCVIYAFITGEVNAFYHLYTAGHFSGKFGVEVVVNGSVALALNFVSMWTNKIAGALSMSVAGNTKQAFTILFGIVLFDVKLGWMNTVGTTVTIAGAMLYSTLEMDSKRA